MDRNAGGEKLGGLVVAAKRRNGALNIGSQLQAESGPDQEVTSGLLLLGMQQQGIEIGGEEPGLRQQRAQSLEHKKLVVQIGTEHAHRLDAAIALQSQLSVELADAVAKSLQIVELALALGTGLHIGIRSVLAVVLAVLVRLAAGVLAATAGTGPPALGI